MMRVTPSVSAYGAATARLATFGRAASVGFTPAASGILTRYSSISILETGGRALGTIERRQGVITLINTRRQRLLRSETVNKNIIHYDPVGKPIGSSTIENGGTRIVHRSNRHDYQGYDNVRDNAVEHFDKRDSYMGTSRLETSVDGAFTEVVGTAGLESLILAYSASILFSDPTVSEFYEELRATQGRCYSLNDQEACRSLKFLNGQLSTLLRSKAT